MNSFFKNKSVLITGGTGSLEPLSQKIFKHKNKRNKNFQ